MHSTVRPTYKLKIQLSCRYLSIASICRAVCPAWLLCEVRASVFEAGKVAAAMIALEKGGGVVITATTPGLRRSLGGHHVETANVSTLVARGEDLSVACQGMHCSRGYREGRSEGVIHVIIQVIFLKYPVQEGRCLIRNISPD